jgi:hypothetical protein
MGSRAACLLATAAVALTPGTALAQGAGDDQYADPFAGEAPRATATPEPAPPAAPPAEAAPEDDFGVAEPEFSSEPQSPPAAPQAAPVAAAAQAPEAQLPYTGADAGLVGAAGAVLLAGGVALRLRVRVPR